MRKVFFHTLAGILSTLLFLEILCRFLPVLHGWENPPLTPANPVIRDRPGAAYVYSHGWDFRNHVEGQFNNVGFPSSVVDIHKLTVLIVGDSYVEAAMIAPSQRMDRLVERRLGRQVTAMGMSNTALPDYMVVANWAAGQMKLTDIVFEIAPGDLAESVTPKIRGYWYAVDPRGNVTLHSNDRFGLRNALMKSRLFDYLYYNLRFSPGQLMEGWKRPEVGIFLGEDQPKSSTGIAGPPDTAMQFAAHRFVADAQALRRRGIRVLFMIAPDIRNIYSGGKGVTSEARSLAPAARAGGLQVLDLAPVFVSDYAHHHAPLDFGAVDVHWNGYAHALAAEALVSELRR